MKMPTLATVAVASAALPGALAGVCTYRGTFPSIRYEIESGNVPDIAGTCAGLWANLQRFADCSPSNTYCGGIQSTNILGWTFNVPIGCDGGMIESTWWEATRNNFGSIHCVQA